MRRESCTRCSTRRKASQRSRKTSLPGRACGKSPPLYQRSRGSMRPGWLSAHGILRIEDYRARSNGQPDDLLESILWQFPHDLDRWAGAAQESGPALERLLRRKMGGRLHVCGGDDGPRPKELGRSCRPPAQRATACRGALPSRRPRQYGTDGHDYDPKYYTEPWQGLKNFPLHLQPAGFDMPEFLCSGSDNAEYRKEVEQVVSPNAEKK